MLVVNGSENKENEVTNTVALGLPDLSQLLIDNKVYSDICATDIVHKLFSAFKIAENHTRGNYLHNGLSILKSLTNGNETLESIPDLTSSVAKKTITSLVSDGYLKKTRRDRVTYYSANFEKADTILENYTAKGWIRAQYDYKSIHYEVCREANVWKYSYYDVHTKILKMIATSQPHVFPTIHHLKKYMVKFIKFELNTKAFLVWLGKQLQKTKEITKNLVSRSSDELRRLWITLGSTVTYISKIKITGFYNKEGIEEEKEKENNTKEKEKPSQFEHTSPLWKRIQPHLIKRYGEEVYKFFDNCEAYEGEDRVTVVVPSDFKRSFMATYYDTELSNTFAQLCPTPPGKRDKFVHYEVDSGKEYKCILQKEDESLCVILQEEESCASKIPYFQPTTLLPANNTPFQKPKMEKVILSDDEMLARIMGRPKAPIDIIGHMTNKLCQDACAFAGCMDKWFTPRYTSIAIRGMMIGIIEWRKQNNKPPLVFYNPIHLQKYLIERLKEEDARGDKRTPNWAYEKLNTEEYRERSEFVEEQEKQDKDYYRWKNQSNLSNLSVEEAYFKRAAEYEANLNPEYCPAKGISDLLSKIL